MADTGGREGVREGRRRRLVAAVISLGALGVGVVHTVRPDLKIDGATLVLAAIAVVPWLGDLFESIELPGGAKFQYRQLQERVEAVEQQAAEAREAVDDASRQARVALVAGGEGVQGAEAEQTVGRLVDEYADLRRREPSGPARTYRQELIFAELARFTPLVADYDTASALGSPDGGTRLAAYARLYARPEEEFLPALVEAAVSEDFAFSQYWAFQAIGSIVDAVGPGNVRLDTVRRLRACLPGLPQESDRVRALTAVLRRLESAAG
ncbi:hypothetical protein [Kitasatospora sp. NPDC056273]|uniref:hypothetical protein n=1 Tax=Kitasatospora sp. NPDC056273 TaxID=3345769 RepID=UPI0035DB6CFB